MPQPMNTFRSMIRSLVLAGLFLPLLWMGTPVLAQEWPGYAHDPQHSCLSGVGSQLLQTIRWSTPVDLDPQYSGSLLYIHYGTPVITAANTVILPVKTGATGGFQMEALNGSTGAILWTLSTDYAVPNHNWFPICGITLTANDAAVAVPGAGGTIYVQSSPNTAGGTTTQLAFYGMANYMANPAAYAAAIQICTPISSDGQGDLYFGYLSSGAALPGYPNGIPSGLARISSTGVGTFVSAAAMCGDSSMQKVAYNCAAAFSSDGTIVYVAVNNGNSGYLCALNSTTLAKQSSIFLLDPRSTANSQLAAFVTDDSSASPTVGPDGDVYYGVLENNLGSNNYRGWLLHFSGDLGTTKLPGQFGWDDTASVVPASAVPSYSGPSSYLLLTKDNNYAGNNGDGVNKLALMDPNSTSVDTLTNTTVMNPFLTVVGVTPDPRYDQTYPNAVREWCINSAAIDPVNKCAAVNSEDGNVYRWDFTTNSLSAVVILATPTGEAYTPTVIGPDGAVYAINNATLFSVVANAQGVPATPRWTVVVLPLLLVFVAGRFLPRSGKVGMKGSA